MSTCDEEHDVEMTKIAAHAQALYASQGNEAEAKAAQKAKQYDEAGNTKEAAIWRAIREAICELRGAPQS